MTTIVTKVKKKARGPEEIFVENIPGWKAVLADLCVEIERLQKLVPIVERKIERGEPWPGSQLANQRSEAATQC
jgi:hypothetical protein